MKMILNLIFSLILGKIKEQAEKQQAEAEPPRPESGAPVISEDAPPKARVHMTLEDWVTSSGRYPERAKSSELTDEVIAAATDLVVRVNALLNDLGWEEPVSISSGFRPSAVNANVSGASKKSAHMTGKALDIFQEKPGNRLGELIRSEHKKSQILKKHGLMMEALEATVGKNSNWVHLDTVPRSERASYEFKP